MKKLFIALISVFACCSAIAQSGFDQDNKDKEFLSGNVYLTDKIESIDSLKWNAHASFKGVYLKHLFTGNETDRKISMHIVKVEPNCMLDTHVHKNQIEIHQVLSGSGTFILEGKEFDYKPGKISVIPMNTPHKVVAGNDGLYLLATFTSALL